MTTSFSDIGVPDDLVDALTKVDIHAPFAIQTASIPDAMDGHDICGKAPTGSGKTLAFSIPVVARVGRAKPNRPKALLLTPTRELAAQIRDTLLPLARARGRWVATFYGGTNINKDIAVLRKGVDIAVATPGRLADLIQRGEFKLSDVQMVVLDEADRMADMGFLPEVRRILDGMPDNRQTLLFSATLDGDIDVLRRNYQKNPKVHSFETPEEEIGDVRHIFWPVDRDDRRHLLARLVRKAEPTIVFTRTKYGAERLAKQLRADGASADAIHGNRSQKQRERALSNLSSGEVTTLVATDVAARGIHVDNVAMVVHYDPPGSDKDYVHRSGRTGRAGATGTVVSFVTREDYDAVDEIQRSLELDRGLHECDLEQIDSDITPPVVRKLAAPGNNRPRKKQGGGGQKRNRNNNGQLRKPKQGAPKGAVKGSSQGSGKGGSQSKAGATASSNRDRRDSGAPERTRAGGPKGNNNGGNRSRSGGPSPSGASRGQNRSR